MTGEFDYRENEEEEDHFVGEDPTGTVGRAVDRLREEECLRRQVDAARDGYLVDELPRQHEDRLDRERARYIVEHGGTADE